MWFKIEVATFKWSTVLTVASLINSILKDNNDFLNVSGCYYFMRQGLYLKANFDRDTMVSLDQPVIFIHGLRAYFNNDATAISMFCIPIQDATNMEVVAL
jgi:hypothetical protein